ncbi:hypothetical protein SEA_STARPLATINUM_223 [Streptomyces phage StarPlatinum]|uniref:Uncharacterized protein n=1 Tax=Streptomyces phage StarPlatinum TaxID=2283265 RepID=A0A345M8W0_9CAUD|nr:hypothetical protein HWB77_gp106 [Streptomyces phage StarPlatinum]AXH66931.1 hypothetical protein SEA_STARPLATINUM_223 [Streptomyces phage StarPlatinum]
MSTDFKKFVEAGKILGTMVLDVAELVLLARKADTAQRKAAEAYMSAYEEQKGKVKSKEDWTVFYNGVKKRLTV